MEPSSHLALNGGIYAFTVNGEAALTCQSFHFVQNPGLQDEQPMLLQPQHSTSCKLKLSSASLGKARVTLYCQCLISPLCLLSTPCVLVALDLKDDRSETRYVFASIDPFDEELRILAEWQEDTSFSVHALLDDFNVVFSCMVADVDRFRLWRFEDKRSVASEDVPTSKELFQLSLNDSRCLLALRKANATADVTKRMRKVVQLNRGTKEDSVIVQFQDNGIAEYKLLQDELKWIHGSAKHALLLVGNLVGVNMIQCLVLSSSGVHWMYDGEMRRKVCLPDGWNSTLQFDTASLRGDKVDNARKRALDVSSLAVSPLLTKRIKLKPLSRETKSKDVALETTSSASLKLAAFSRNLKRIIDRGRSQLQRVSGKVLRKEIFAKLLTESSSKRTIGHSLGRECVTQSISRWNDSCFPHGAKPVTSGVCYCPSAPFTVELQTLSLDDAARFTAKINLSLTAFCGDLPSITVTATSVVPVYLDYDLAWSTADTIEESTGELSLRGCAAIDKNRSSHLNLWQQGVDIWLHWIESKELCSQKVYCVSTSALQKSDTPKRLRRPALTTCSLDTVVLKESSETVPSSLTRMRLLRCGVPGTALQIMSTNVHEFYSQVKSLQQLAFLAMASDSKCSIFSLSSEEMLKRYFREFKAILTHLSKGIEEAQSLDWWTQYIFLKAELARLSLEASTVRVV